MPITFCGRFVLKNPSANKKLGIPLHVIDLRNEYQKCVIDHSKGEYLAGKTPNLCVVCNQRLKFGLLLERVKEAGIDFDLFATGHYAKIEKSGERYLLKKAVDRAKDQSYFLYSLTPAQLENTVFLLGNYTKHEVRGLARSMGLQTADRPESQDFIAGGNYARVLFDHPQMSVCPGQHAVFYTDDTVLGGGVIREPL